MSKFRGVKTNNKKTTKKTEIRRSIFDAITGERRVLDVFCGDGKMYDEIWHEADDYLGIDKVKFFDKRKTMCGDARKCLTKTDVSNFNIFDIDSYGSPYEVLSDVLRNAGDHEEIGFVLTDGTNIDLKMGRISKGMRKLTGIDFKIAKRANIIHDALIDSVIDAVCTTLQGHIKIKRIAKSKQQSAMRYIGFVVSRDAVSALKYSHTHREDKVASHV